MTDLSTIDELMEGKKPGEIKIRQIGWDSKKWFQPFFATSGEWTGILNNESGTPYRSVWYGDEALWQLWSEPKKKVKRWQWAVWFKDLAAPKSSSTFFTSEEEARAAIVDESNIKIMQRLDFTEQEFDE